MIVYPTKNSFTKYLGEIYRFRYFLVLMSKKWIKSKYEHSYLGLGWVIASPLITTFVYTLFFGMAFNVDPDKVMYFLFIYSGLLPWIFFKDVFLEIVDIFPREPHIVKRAAFPRIIIPLSVVLLKLVEFLFGIVFLLIMAYFAGKEISVNIFLLPVLIVQILMISIGAGLIFLLPRIKYRDIKHLLRFVIPLGIYSLPIIYKLKLVPQEWLRLYTLNPLVSVIHGFRVILFKEVIPGHLLIKGMVIAVLIFVIGVWRFMRYEKRLPDYI